MSARSSEFYAEDYEGEFADWLDEQESQNESAYEAWLDKCAAEEAAYYDWCEFLEELRDRRWVLADPYRAFKAMRGEIEYLPPTRTEGNVSGVVLGS